MSYSVWSLDRESVITNSTEPHSPKLVQKGIKTEEQAQLLVRNYPDMDAVIWYTKEKEETVEIFVDGQKWTKMGLPEGPLYIVWNPLCYKPIRYVYTEMWIAKKAAREMAKRHQRHGAVFYVAALISAHQQQLESVEFPLKLAFV